MKTKHLRLMQRVYIVLFFCFMYLPIAYMIVFSFNQSKGYSLFTGFTLKCTPACCTTPPSCMRCWSRWKWL